MESLNINSSNEETSFDAVDNYANNNGGEDSFETVIDHELVEYDDRADNLDINLDTIKIVNELFLEIQISLDIIKDNPEEYIYKIQDEYGAIINDYDFVIKDDPVLKEFSNRLKININKYEQIYNIKKEQDKINKEPENSQDAQYQKYYYVQNQLFSVLHKIDSTYNNSALDIIGCELNVMKKMYSQIILQHTGLVEIVEFIQTSLNERKQKILNQIDIKSDTSEENLIVKDKLIDITIRLRDLGTNYNDEIITKICDDFYAIQTTYVDIILESSTLVLIESKIKYCIAEYYDKNT